MSLAKSPFVEFERLEHTITVPPTSLCFNVTLFFQLISQVGKLVVILMTDAVAPILPFENLYQILVSEIVAIFDIIVFSSYSDITNILVFDRELFQHVNLSWQ